MDPDRVGVHPSSQCHGGSQNRQGLYAGENKKTRTEVREAGTAEAGISSGECAADGKHL